MKKFIVALVCMFGLIASGTTSAAVDYEAGILTLNGVQVFRDADNASQYYYLPQYPRVVVEESGEFRFLLMKQVGGQDENVGGIFHALIEFTLPEDVVNTVETKLQQLRPGAELMGALPLLQPGENDAVGAFRVISATLDPSAPPERFVGRVIASGPAPLTSGSRAAIAAKLSKTDATVLMESMRGTTSDLSIAIRGFYEARVQGYNAIVRANMDTVYEHDSVVDNLTRGFTKREARQIVDALHQDGALEVDVYDSTDALGIDDADLSRVLDLVTDKLLEVMFDTQAGWSKVPDPEVVVAQGQVAGRQEQGWFGKIFGGPEDLPYYTDDQYTIKKRKDIRSNSFYLNLSQTTNIRIPFDSTGNIGGFYDALTASERDRYFRVIDVANDIDLESQDVIFQLDGNVADEFDKTFNFVTVNTRHSRPGDDQVITNSMHFSASDVMRGKNIDTVTLSRLGNESGDWKNLEYQVAWSLRGNGASLRQPVGHEDWLSTGDGSLTLTPPLDRVLVDVFADNREFKRRGIVAAVVQLMSEVNGEVKFVADHRILASEADPSAQRVVYHDHDEPLAYRVIWHTREGKRAKVAPRLVEGGIIVVAAPEEEWLGENAE